LNSKKKLTSHSLYTFLSLLSFHFRHPQTQAIGQREFEFCLEILEEKFKECANTIGRDFVRVLYDCTFIPKIEGIYKSNLEEISKVLMIPTNQKFLQNKITPEIEKNLLFMMTEVKMGNQRRYQQFFHQKYFTNETSTDYLIIDLIR
jgi:integrator complex subunit 3